LSEPWLKKNRSGEIFRQWVYLAEGGKYHIHFTTIEPKSGQIAQRCQRLKVQIPLVVENPKQTIMRPYPEGLPEASKIFEQEKIFVIKIPSKQVNYIESIGTLNHWETFIYQYNPIFTKYRNLVRKREFDSKALSALKKEIKDLLIEKPLAVVEGKYSGDTPTGLINITLDKRYQPDEDIDCFAYGVTHDVAKVNATKNGGNPSSDLGSEFRLYKYAGKIEPAYNLLKKISRQDEIAIQKNLKQLIDASWDDKKILNEVEVILVNMYWPETVIARILRSFFILVTAETLERCTLYALSHALDIWNKGMVSYETDLSASTRFITPYILSAKSFGFATGSDAFSESETPKHIYVQLNDWWHQQLYEYQKKEIEEQVIEIEVIGYSSKMTKDETDNERLRIDRAWKTAIALEAILADEGYNFVARPDSERSKQPPIQRRPPYTKSVVRNIYYKAAEKDEYPKRALFKTVGVFEEDLIGSTDISERNGRADQNNDAEDRISLVVFKRLIPDEVNQVVKDVLITNTAYPIYRYKKIWSSLTADKKNVRALIYVCPGKFVP
jgi:hypothetical protein